MCVPHGVNGFTSNGFIDDKPKKHIVRVSQTQFEKGDPDFVDERKTTYEPKEKKKSIFSFLFE